MRVAIGATRREPTEDPMRKHTTRGLALVYCLVPAVVAWTAVTNVLTLQPASRLWVKGTSTVRSFECKAAALDAKVEATGPGASAALMGGEKVVTAASVTVPAARLDCNNGTMNSHMLKALKAAEHPTIEFRVDSYTLAEVGEGVQAQLNGNLTLGGVRKPVTVSATGKD